MNINHDIAEKSCKYIAQIKRQRNCKNLYITSFPQKYV